MRFLELRNDTRTATPSAPKLRRLLALLAVRSNRVVTTDTLMEELWGDDLPVSALATLQTYVYQVRRVLSDVDPSGQLLATRPLGYTMGLDHGGLDWNLFQDDLKAGGAALERGDAETASVALGRALALSPAAPLADVEPGPVLAAHVSELREAKLQALELRIEADMRLGRQRELVAELKTLVVEHPFHEGFYSRLMLCLDRSGRRSEALDVYRRLRTTLVGELGIEPSDRIRRLQTRLLAAHEGPAAAEPGGSRVITLASQAPRPAQLPAELPDFVGRGATVTALCDLVVGTDHTPPVRLLTVTGMVGIGKSALALQVAHRVRDHFPDGQFFAELGSGTEEPADAFAVLGRFLRATGVADADLPRDLEERTQLFRSWTVDRAVLVVLDDAGSAADVRALLPSGSRCAVLVTARSWLPGLDGGRVVELEPLEVDACVELLGSLVGRDRVEREEDMVYSIAGLCGRLPLAIRIIGSTLAASPYYPLRKTVLRLSDERRLLRELSVGEYDIGVRIARDHARLSPDARALLADIVAEGRDRSLSVGVAAAVADLDMFTTELLLEELVRACFLRAVDLDGHGAAGFAVPPVVRSFLLQRREEDRPGSTAGTVIRRPDIPTRTDVPARTALVGTRPRHRPATSA